MRVPSGFDVQGHRGARGLAPENSLPAFRRALDLGVTTLELDTVISADHEVVVSHDPWISSVFCAHPDGTPVQPDEEEHLLIYRMLYAEVARFDCGSRPDPRFPRQQCEPVPKPLLREAIRFAEAHARKQGRPPAYYNVETKSTPAGDGPSPEVFVRLLYEVAVGEGIGDRLTLQSFDVRTLQEARRRALPVRLSLLVEDARPGEASIEDTSVEGASVGGERLSPVASLHAGLDALGFVPDIYSPQYTLVDPAVVEAAHARGMAVVPWTVNERAEMARLKALGVDGLITDYPDVAMESGLRE